MRRHGSSLDVLDCRRVLYHDFDGVWVSDHFGVLAELGVPAHRPGAWAVEPSDEGGPGATEP